AAVMDAQEPRPALLGALESLFKFSPLPTAPSKTPLMMIGPPGTGKTLAAAKLAARSAMNGLDVAVITTDTERAGGREQLEAFTKLMDVDLEIASTATELKEALLKNGTVDQIIIDTAATNPFDPQAVKSLAKLIGATEIDPVLVMPAGIQSDESGEVAQIFSTIGARYLLPSRVDVARRLGSLLSAAYHGGLAFTDLSATARVADGLSQCSPKRLTQLLMPRAESGKMQQTVNSTGTG
ncbi:MAG: GTPase, partial [Pseudomonadota bacterium]